LDANLNFEGEGGENCEKSQNSKNVYCLHGVIENIFLGTYADLIEFP